MNDLWGLINQLAGSGLLGLLLALSIVGNVTLGKLLLNEKDARRKDAEDRLTKADEQQQAAMLAYKTTIDVLKDKK